VRYVLTAFLFGALIVGAARPSLAQETKVLRVVPQSDLKILDPIWTTAFVTRNHGYAIYDTLFGVDAEGQVRPQMVGEYSSSADHMKWSFTLREGLYFHDGKPVTSADVIQSLKRWGERDSLGQRLFAAMESIEAKSDTTFQITLKQPFGLVLEALSKPASIASTTRLWCERKIRTAESDCTAPQSTKDQKPPAGPHRCSSPDIETPYS